jgi:hypothetical protein
MSPMDRWGAETLKQSPWNDLEGVGDGNGNPDGARCASEQKKGGSTEDGTWVP